MKALKYRPQKSLRTLLMVWFLTFSVVPLAFITGYSLVKYEQAIDKELLQRLKGNEREITIIMNEFESSLRQKIKEHSVDKRFKYLLTSNLTSQAREMAKQWMLTTPFISTLTVFNSEGRAEISLHRDGDGGVRRQRNYEGVAFYMSEAFMNNIKREGENVQVDFQSGKKVDLVMTVALRTPSGRTVGFVEEIISMDEVFLQNLKNRLDISIFFFVNREGQNLPGGRPPIVASHDDLEHYNTDFFMRQYKENKDGVFELLIQDVTYGFKLHQFNWGNERVYLGIGASKQAAQTILSNVNYAFFSVVGAIIVLLIFLSLVISRILMRPLSELVNAIQSMDLSKGLEEVPITTDTELGVLTESFNDMSRRVNEAQGELKEKISELEKANQERRDTQAKLVHTAKMASLGQLVAGIAHELNNPIGFIYSNMEHLREYSNQLMHLVQVAETQPQKLEEEKEKNEYNYLVEDLPKLIKSCEDGARRTRDIVLGLRNFSRLEEARMKKIDLAEAIENTLQLLSGELKGRIEVIKMFEPIPLVECYPSQLNQVFMNILSNAAQAIEDRGTITIGLKQESEKIVITIKDTGKGMDKSTQEKIFDPFFTTKTPGKGTGLGLSITYGIIEKHNGEMQVVSQVGQGTEFIITLPV